MAWFVSAYARSAAMRLAVRAVFAAAIALCVVGVFWPVLSRD